MSKDISDNAISNVAYTEEQEDESNGPKSQPAINVETSSSPKLTEDDIVC